MKTVNFIVNITSDNPERLKAFYIDTIGLEPDPMSGTLVVMPGVSLAIDGHTDTRGPAKEPSRIIIDFFVEDVAAEEARLKGKGVPFIREQGVEWWGGVISTFTDPDGNYCQVIQFDPSRATANPEEAQAPTG